jgi:Flp pilus assembly protein TadD
LVGVSAAVVVLQFAGLTIMRNEVWGSSVSLAEEAVRLSPGQWVPRLFLGETLRQAGRCAEAVPEYRAVLARHGMASFTRVKLLGCLLQTDQVADARIVLQEMPEPDRRALCGAVPGSQCQ